MSTSFLTFTPCVCIRCVGSGMVSRWQLPCIRKCWQHHHYLECSTISRLVANSQIILKEQCMWPQFQLLLTVAVSNFFLCVQTCSKLWIETCLLQRNEQHPVDTNIQFDILNVWAYNYWVLLSSCDNRSVVWPDFRSVAQEFEPWLVKCIVLCS